MRKSSNDVLDTISKEELNNLLNQRGEKILFLIHTIECMVDLIKSGDVENASEMAFSSLLSINAN